MDITMPEMDGFEATREIRRLEFGRGHHTPIIACSSHPEEEVLQNCIGCGMDDYLPKPVRRELLKEKLKLWLGPDSIESTIPPLHGAVLSTDNSTAPLDIRYLQSFYGAGQLYEIIDSTLPVMKGLLGKLAMAIETQNIEAVRGIADQMIGSGHAIDARKIAELSFQIEQRPENWPETAQAFAALAFAFAKLEKFAQNMRQSAAEVRQT
jgi:CheY-like chemotaxis protein